METAKISAQATPRKKTAVSTKVVKGRKIEEKETGASRIPCPPPVAIGPSNLIPGAAAFVPYVAGLDKLLVSFWLDGDGFDEFRLMLQEFKDEFHDEKLCGLEVFERSLDIGWEGGSFNMSRTGAGKYPYKLQSGDIVLKFSNHKPTASFPNCCIEIHSMSCWNPGWKAVLNRFFDLLKQLGCIIRKQTITEHHITVDLMDVDFAKTGLINHRRWLSRATKKISATYEHYNPNYISFGKGDFMLRCYDKPADLKNDQVKRDFFYSLWFDRVGYVPEHVTRIEFQIRRAVSKELEINTVDDLESKLDAIWQYCVNDWCRFCSKKISSSDRKNKHQQRYATAFLWEFVRSIRFGLAPAVRLERKKQAPKIDIEGLMKAGTGCLLSACAGLCMNAHDFDGHIVQCFNMIKEQIHIRYKKDSNAYVRKMETKTNAAYSSLWQ
jgi:hypothetical protein